MTLEVKCMLLHDSASYRLPSVERARGWSCVGLLYVVPARVARVFGLAFSRSVAPSSARRLQNCGVRYCSVGRARDCPRTLASTLLTRKRVVFLRRRLCAASCSRARSGHDELHHHQGPGVSYHVVPARPFPPPLGRGQHLRQEPRRDCRQQGKFTEYMPPWREGRAVYSFKLF